jgi:SWI/SNF-related matrix-associated actin-dependent regulator 1 of chromatin subfamily A
MEGYTSLYVLRPDLFYNFGKYGKRYCDPIPTPFGINWSGASYTKELHFILSTMMIRRLKKDVLSELPPKRRSKIEIEVDKKILEQIKNNEKVNNGINNESVMDLYSLSGLAKIKGVIEYISDLLESDEKFLLFAHHQIVLNSIEEFLKRKKKKYIRIDGKTPQEMRFEYVKQYQEDINYKVALLSINAASTGLTLTSANIVVFAELIWTPALMIQAEDRAHRIGQEHNCVNIHYLYASDTLDEVIFSKLNSKHHVVTTTLDNKSKDLNVEKIKEKIGEFVKINGKCVSVDERKKNCDQGSFGNKNLECYFEKKNMNLHVVNNRRGREDVQDEVKGKEIKEDKNIEDLDNEDIEKLFLL